MLKTAAAVSSLLLALSAAGPDLAAQNFNSSPRTGEMLLTIAGEYAAVQYSPGFLDRANHVLRRLDVVAADFKKRGKSRLALRAVVIPREQWEAAQLPRPYGLPVPLPGSTVVVPALGDAEMVAMWKRWLGSDLPRVDGIPVRGTVEDASSLVLADLFLQRELAALFVDAHELAGSELWMRSFLAQLVAITVFGRYEPTRLLEIETVYYRLSSQMPLLLDLAGSERDMPMEKWLRLEGLHFKAALEIYKSEGERALTRALKERRKGGTLTRARLLALFPSLSTWLESGTEPSAVSPPTVPD